MNIKNIKPAVMPPTLEQQIDKAAKMYEQQFLQEMMQAMRKTVEHTNEPSMAERIYQDELHSQYVEKWADAGGNGLAEQIARELKEKILPAQYSKYTQPQAAAKAEPAHTVGMENPAGPALIKNIKK